MDTLRGKILELDHISSKWDHISRSKMAATFVRKRHAIPFTETYFLFHHVTENHLTIKSTLSVDENAITE